MGHEIAQFIEWREYEGLEWFLLDFDNHEKYQKYIKTLNHIYADHPALWSNDTDWEGFSWIDPDNRGQNVLTFIRQSGSDKDEDRETLVCVFNAGTEAFDEFEIGVPEPGYYKEIINSDDEKFAGSGRVNTRQVKARKKPMHGMPYSITVRMPVIGGAIFRHK
jgi:1,4-alpha-glucan branching enzyme